MGSDYIGSWKGGRIRQTRRGPIYVLEQMRGGERFKLNLPSATPEDAEVELKLFDRDPVAYRKALQGSGAPGPLVITLDLVKAFLAHLLERKRSEVYRANVRNYLAWWIDQLGSEDLRTLTLRELHQRLDTEQGARRHRIVALKSFCSWLRERGELSRAQDPTVDLKVPQGRASKTVREKLVNVEQLAVIYKLLNDQFVRDIIRLRICTGLHHTEVSRLARGEGLVNALPAEFGEIAGTLKVIHKSGQEHIQSVDAACLAAALRLQVAKSEKFDEDRGAAKGRPEKRPADNKVVDKALAEAAKLAKLPKPEQGAFRHSFITLARQAGRVVKPPTGGVSLAEVAAAVGHTSMATTAKFYDQTQVPAMVVVPVKLHHPEDPALLQRKPADKSRGG